MPTLYGITNCSTVVKARNWLESNSIKYDFHDYKKLGIDVEHLKIWCAKLGWEKVLNMQGQMWRKASEEDKAKVINENSAIEFMLRVPTAIKRPIVELEDGDLLRGFELDIWEKKLLE
jgi:arsenate reductase